MSFFKIFLYQSEAQFTYMIDPHSMILHMSLYIFHVLSTITIAALKCSVGLLSKYSGGRFDAIMQQFFFGIIVVKSSK